jgi:hypothetical protein
MGLYCLYQNARASGFQGQELKMTNHPNRSNTRYVQFMRFWAITNRILKENGLADIGFGEAKLRFDEMREIYIAE